MSIRFKTFINCDTYILTVSVMLTFSVQIFKLELVRLAIFFINYIALNHSTKLNHSTANSDSSSIVLIICFYMLKANMKMSSKRLSKTSWGSLKHILFAILEHILSKMSCRHLGTRRLQNDF